MPSTHPLGALICAQRPYLPWISSILPVKWRRMRDRRGYRRHRVTGLNDGRLAS
jgi:hypothetical protein